jgi:membrane protease subunit HflC
MRSKLLLALGLVLVLACAASAVYTVDRSEFVYVTQFGKRVQVHDGNTDAGLHFKLPWPVQSVQRLDHRLQFFDLPATELPTRDAEGKAVDKMLTIVAYVCWQIPDGEGVDRFIRTVGTPERAREILGQRVRSRLGAEVGTMHLDELVSIAPADVVEERMDRLRKRLLETGGPHEGGSADGKSLKELARSAYGIDLVDIRLRRYNYPVQVHESIYARIRSERNKKVADFRSDGETKAAMIESTAKREASEILTTARAEEERLKKVGDVQARDILTRAHSKDWQFYFFLEKLKNGQDILGASKDVLVLSSKSEIFDFLFKPPRPNGAMAPPAAAGPVTAQKPPKAGGK